MKQVAIGRRQVDFEKFVDAVNNSKRYTEVCEKLGFNSTVATTKTAIKDKIDELGLDISHFEYKYTKSDKWSDSTSNRIKSFNLSNENQQYYETFEASMKPQSWPTYKASIGNFLENLDNRDFATVSITDITEYVGDKKNAEAHLRSLMIYIVKNNVCNAVDKVSKEMLIWLI